MVTEAKIERYELKKKYPGINPTLADRVLTSADRMGKSGITQVGENFQNYVGFVLLLDAYLLRRGSNDELAGFALKTAEKMVPSLFRKERELAENDLLLVAPGRQRKTERKENETTAIHIEEVSAKTPAFWSLVEAYGKMEGAGNEMEAYTLLQKAVLLLNKMESNEAQRKISEIESRIQPESAALVLLEIIEREKRPEVITKATAHFVYCIQDLDPEAVGIVTDLKEVLKEDVALEALKLLVTRGKEAAQIRIIEGYPSVGVNYARSFLDCKPDRAGARIEVIKDIAGRARSYQAIPRLVSQLNLESEEPADMNLATAVIEVLNKCDYPVLGGVIDELGLRASEHTVGHLEFIADQMQTKPHVREAAVRALRLTGQTSAMDVAERFLKHKETGVRAAAYHALGKLAFLNEPLVESLFCFGVENNEEDPRIRKEIIQWLGKNGEGAGLSALQRMMSREETEVALLNAAAKAVEAICEKNRKRSLPAGKKHSRITVPVISISDVPAQVRITPMKKISGPPK